MAKNYSALRLVRNAVRSRPDWTPVWRNPSLKRRYDVIIIGGGGHGLATAYYLASRYGIRNVAVLEKGWIGGGNSGRNTTAVRSNYFYPESSAFYDFSLKLYEGLSHDLNFNVMLSQRGIVTLAHTKHDLEIQRRSANAMMLNGVESVIVDREGVRRLAPILNFASDARFPIEGGILQTRAGTARHDAVVWGYARAADQLGVDIIQNCEVLGFEMDADGLTAVQTSRGRVEAGRVGAAVAGQSSALARKAGFKLPIISYALQAMVSEPLKPVLNTVVMSGAAGVYVSQSDKGGLVIGGGLDLYPSYGQRGEFAQTQAVIAGVVSLFPCFSRVRIARQWAGTVDVVHDSSPIIGPSPIPNLFLNCGWGTGGFKAIPAGGFCFAHLLANGTTHELTRSFGMDRFTSGTLIDEAAASGIAH